MDFGELLTFLSNPKAEVVEQAADAVLDLTEDPDFLTYIRREPAKISRPLIRLIERDDIKIQMAALNALVNISSIPEVALSLISLQGVRRTCDVLKTLWIGGVDKEAVVLCSMILSNLTLPEAGQTALIQHKEGLNFILPLYLAPPVAKEDIFFHMGSILRNISGTPEGRKIVADPRLTAGLAPLFMIRHRRCVVADIFRNLCGDKKCHKELNEVTFLPYLQTFLYPDDAVKPEHTTLHPFVKEEATGLTGDEPLRFTCAELLLFLVRSDVGREMMRNEHVYECIRAWHLEESQDEVKEIIEEIVPFIHFSEEELKEEGALEESNENNEETAKDAHTAAGDDKKDKKDDALETATAASSAEGQDSPHEGEDEKRAEAAAEARGQDSPLEGEDEKRAEAAAEAEKKGEDTQEEVTPATEAEDAKTEA